LKNRVNNLLICILFLTTMFIPTACNSMDKSPEPSGPTAIVIDDETGKPIEGAVAITIWRGKQKNCTIVGSLEGACWGFLRAEETLSDKEGKISIPDFWKTTIDPGKRGSATSPRLTIYKFGYVCWDQQEIFVPKNRWEKRTDFNRGNRIVRLKKWPENMSKEEHSLFISDTTRDDYFKTKDELFVNELWPKKDRKSHKTKLQL
jgi:hypothetical protein